ncbi:zinc-binding alcohol dehydrogenase family protein [Flammeovirga pectinis]|uniref:Zinc-binding alcohol dehydrogenase family protein n=1 Tax=Flammeovirga pectinis TaxID=2494373 RepID=A0A3S9P699_9BACT|nr:zinc-binding alcohol dehydrogenase family protein [Flammeovirga pectinis]AZQ63749.1 zinc-binding alcohol dehydrogenase family protein [Flammeovirga pectinis]
MKQLVICPNNFHKHYEDTFSYGKLKFNGKDINYALIETEDTYFNPNEHVDKVLIRKKAFSCNYRDLSILLLQSERINNNSQIAYTPFGSEFSGIIEDIGNNVVNFKVGDRVICNGSYDINNNEFGLPSNGTSKELEIIDIGNIIHMPSKMSYAVGAGFTIGAQTVYSMINKLKLEKKAKVLLTGIRANTSLFALSALKKNNIDVYGLTRSKINESLFKKHGMKEIFNFKEEEGFLSNPSLYELIKKTGGFDAIIDPFTDSYFFDALKALKFNGKYITCGLSNQFDYDYKKISLNTELAALILKNLKIIGNCLGKTEDLREALDDFQKGNLYVFIDSITNDPIEFMNQSFINKNRLGKVIFEY